MLICEFSSLFGSAQSAPAKRLSFVRGALYVNDETKAAAMRSYEHWRFRGVDYTRLDVAGPVIVTLKKIREPNTPRVEPHTRVWFSAGTLQSQSGVVATLDAHDIWCIPEGADRYDEIVIEDGRHVLSSLPTQNFGDAQFFGVPITLKTFSYLA